MALTASAFNAAWGHIIAMGTGFLFLKYRSLQAQGLGIGSIMENHRSHQARKSRGNLRLIKDEEEEVAPQNAKHDPKDPKFWQ